MKIIISHDVDHYEWTDHFTRDLFILKFLVRNNIQLLQNKVPLADYFRRYQMLTINRQHRLYELIKFNKEHQIPSTFFIGMRNGLNLSYSYAKAKEIVQLIRENDPDADIGVHGIAYNAIALMQEEYKKLKSVCRGANGIRMHYLRKDDSTLQLLNQVGYKFDSTTYEIKNPYAVGQLIEFPVSVMDVSVVSGKDFHKIKEKTLAIIDTAAKKGLSYFTVIFHDFYFDKGFSMYKDWYTWLVELFISRGMEFTSFNKAVQELEASVKSSLKN